MEHSFMYLYYDKEGKKLWTSNIHLAITRADAHDSAVYEIPKDKLAEYEDKNFVK